MIKDRVKVTSLCIGIFLFIVSTITPIVIGYKANILEGDEFFENLFYLSSKKYNSIKVDYYKFISQRNGYDNLKPKEMTVYKKPLQTLILPLMNSPWPMKCHDTHHTGLSSYSTADNPYDEIWRFYSDNWIEGGPVIDNYGNIYFGGGHGDLPWYLIALFPDGTFKWRYKTGGLILSTPAISKDGTIYIGTFDSKLYAINPDGTLKWKCGVGGNVACSPTISEDGTIYVGTMSSGYSLVAVTPNGTVKWKYKTGYHITGAPAIDDDGIIYVGSGDYYFYAVNPNGTLKWRFKTGYYIKGPPSIAEDGTIYIASGDNYLYAFYPNGTLKWKSRVGQGPETNPSIGSDGTIYVGSPNGYLYAIYPNGTRRWSFKVEKGYIHQSSPAISSDGTIYFGTDSTDSDKGYIYAINPDGTERWRKKIANDWVESSPCIGRDGTIYIGSSSSTEGGDGYGYLYAFNRADLSADADGPHYGLINEPVQFNGTGFGGYKPYMWHWDFGDGNTSNERNPIHTYTSPDNYTVTLTVTDNTSNTSMDSTFAWIQDGNNPPDIPSIEGPAKGNTETKYDYTFRSSDPEGLHIWYYINWDDGEDTGWIGPYDSGVEIVRSHKWSEKGTFIIKCRAKDPYGAESNWAEFDVEIPRTRAISYHWFLECFPMLERLLEMIR
jgi:outer membrane protein assembly factor BamB